MNRTLLHYYVQEQSFEEIERMLRIAHEYNYDFVPFIRDGTCTILSQAVWSSTTQFKVAWDSLLSTMGYSEQQIRAQDNIYGFYRNIFVIRPWLLEKLSAFMNRAMTVIQTNKTVNAAFAHNACYGGGDPKVAMTVFNTSYYQFHPFVLERLPAFFIYHERDSGSNIRICSGPGTSCLPNYSGTRPF